MAHYRFHMTGKVHQHAAGSKGGDKRYQEGAKYQNTFGPKIANGMPIHEQLL